MTFLMIITAAVALLLGWMMGAARDAWWLGYYEEWARQLESELCKYRSKFGPMEDDDDQ